MKHILIILSILLLSSPLFGQETGVLFLREVNDKWGWFEVHDVKIWIRIFWKMFTNGKYVGEIENEEPNGQGTLIYSSGIKYVGEWKDGRIIYTSTTFFDGRKYVGEYNGVPNGQGTMIFENGHKYEGEWKNGEKWNITGYDQNGNKEVKWLNGVLQK